MSFQLFEGDFDTSVGSCIRDYLNVQDVATAHVLAMKHLQKSAINYQYDVLNISSGRPISVLELIE